MSAININKNNVQNEVMNSDKPVLLDFWAPWCGPCRMVVPILEEIARERSDIKVGKVNVDEQPELASQFGVMSIPTLVVMKNGEIVSQAMGARPKNAILGMLQGGVTMGFFDFFKQADINQGIKEYSATPGAVLLDVRTAEEYRGGHIPGSKNVPLQSIDKIASVAENKDTVLFVYCYSGARSRQAAGILQRMGYTNVNNIGGIAAYAGKVEV